MNITGNRGEWSEAYTLLRLLADGKLFAADEQLNKIEDMFFPIIKIIREETIGSRYDYATNEENAEIEIYLNDEPVLRVLAKTFDDEANKLLDEISRGKGKGAFEIPRAEAFIRSIYVEKLKAKSANKSDINIQIHDINTGFEKVVGFSIKSDLGSPPTLLNAGETTNFIYKVEKLDPRQIPVINSIDTDRKIKDRITAINDCGGKLVFHGMQNTTFNENLIMIDSQMPMVIAEMLVGYYSGAATKCQELAKYVIDSNPLRQSENFYRHNIKELLCAVALGMKPATSWDGTDEATGGYIIVKTNGDVVAYHIYNRDSFRNYLLNNTKFESAGSTKHKYAELYEQDDDIFIKLNLQIRFS